MDDAGRRVERRLRAVAVACAAVSVVLCASAVTLVVVARSRGLDVRAPHAGDGVVGSLFPLAGLLVLWRQPRNACGWVLLSCTSIAVSTLSHAWVDAAGRPTPAPPRR